MEQLTPAVTPSTVSDTVADATSVLVTGPTGDDRLTAVAMSLLSEPEPTETHVRWVTMTHSPAQTVQTWSAHVDDPPAAFEVVVVGEGGHGLTDGDRSTQGVTYSTTHIPSPSDLTALGIRLTEGTSPQASGSHHRLWFESLSTLLQYVSVGDALRFMHAIHGRFAGTDAAVSYHLDPALHDSKTVHALLSVCDARVALDDDEIVASRR